MENVVKSGKEILDDFFDNIENIDGVNPEISKLIAALYSKEKLTDTNLKNALQELRKQNEG